MSGLPGVARRAAAGALLVLVVALGSAGCGGRQATGSSAAGGGAFDSAAPVTSVPATAQPSAPAPGGASSPTVVVQQDDLDALSAALADEKALETEVNDEMAADSP